MSSERLLHIKTPPINRDLNAARRAYDQRDISATRRAHAGVIPSSENFAAYFEDHSEPHVEASGDTVKALVFGGLDGIVTIFAIVAGCVGADITPTQVIIIGIGNLLADAFSMGFGEYISAQAEQEFVHAEKVREQWEIDNCPEGEKGEMIEIYQTKYGITYDDAQQMIDIAFKYPKFFLAHMMTEELGLTIDEEIGPTPLLRGIVMFGAFGCFGMVPLLGFSVWLTFMGSENVHRAFIATCTVTLFTLFVLGLFKARFANQNGLTSGLFMALNGTVASLVAYGSGALLQNIVGDLTGH